MSAIYVTRVWFKTFVSSYCCFSCKQTSLQETIDRKLIRIQLLQALMPIMADNMKNETSSSFISSYGTNGSAEEANTSGEDIGSNMGPTPLATSVGAFVMSLFFIEGLLGNLLIIIAIISNKKVRNVTNAFIVSLCVNDVLTLSLVVAFIIDSYAWRSWKSGDVLCRLNPELNVALTGSSLWHSALIAVHRYIVVVHNDYYKRLSKTPAYVIFVLVAARIIPLACTVPGFSLDTSGYAPKMLRCVLLPTQKSRMLTVTLVGIVTPCIIVAVCYSVVFCVVCRVARRARGGTDARVRRELKITKMFAMAFATILLGFVPYSIVRNADRANTFHADIYVLVSVFYGVASCMNPFIYGVMSTQVKEACVVALRHMLRATRTDRLFCCSKCLLLKSPNGEGDTINENTVPLVATMVRDCKQTERRSTYALNCSSSLIISTQIIKWSTLWASNDWINNHINLY